MTERDGPASDGGEGAEQDSALRVITLVGIGASAGGLTALREFFRAVPPDSGLAFVVVVHLDAEHESEMASLLQTQTSIPVSQVTKGFHPQPNNVYVIPPNKHLMAKGDAIELSPRDNHAPIDLFFRTLADSYGRNAVGVVLSGTGSDGTEGVRRIHAAGGVTIVQTPDEAEFSSMPTSAIATGFVDAVLRVGEMPARLVALKDSDPQWLLAMEHAAQDDDPPEPLRRINQQLLKETGHDFSEYKQSTFLRRLERRMRSRQVATTAEYARLLGHDAEEVKRLLQDLLISVSSFFRDPQLWEAVERRVIPGLFEGKGPEDSLRAWVAGCATGEEAYTLAMLLKEHASTLPEPPNIQIFATDIDDRACREARAGAYPSSIAADLSPARLRRFFQPMNDGVQVVDYLRDMVLFASHDVLQNPPFSNLDVVTCRNLLIYLQTAAQDRVLRTFHYALRPGGSLFLGSSEFAGESGFFSAVDPKSRIYVRADVARILPRLAARATDRSAVREGPAPAPAVAEDFRGFSYGPLHLRMLEQYAPPSLVVDSTGRVVHLSPGAGRYTRLPGGVPKWNVVDLVPDEMRLDLRALLNEAFHDGGASHRAVHVEIDGQPRVIDLQVRPLLAEDGRKDHALVIFAERPQAEDGDAVAELPGEEPDPGTVARLEKQVERANERLASVLNERDVIVEKLQATNEELQSINEQHRTALEEMETSNEELQSLNEEMSTVNQEHRGTIDELKLTSADLNNLVEASTVATIFLDRQLNVRRISPSISSMFNLRPTDQGRPFAHFTHGLKYDEMVADAERTLSAMESIEREVSDGEGRWYSVRMRPYRFGDDRIGGVVITLYEITEAKQHEAAEQDARRRAEAEEARLEALMRQLPAGVLIIDTPSGKVLSANDRARDIWGRIDLPFDASPGAVGAGYSARSSDGTNLDQESWPISRMLRTGLSIRGEEIEVTFDDGRRSVLLMNGVPVRVAGDTESQDLGAIVTLLDITLRKAMEEELRTAKGRAEVANRTKGFFMSALSHEFRTPLNAILGYTDLLSGSKGITDAQSAKLGRIRYAVEHLDGMIDEIVGLSGLDEQKTSVAAVTGDARIAAEAAVEMCETLAAAAGLEFRFELPEDQVELTTDHNRLRMILINLIGNAIKFTERGRVEFSIRVHVDRVGFEVLDTGLGIAPENHELIFERYWQVSHGLTRSAGGVGIGLAAARELSRTMGGDIELRSELGGGSVFTLWLPRGATRPDVGVLGAPESGST